MPAAPEPSAAPTLAPGANSSANGTLPSHLTQIKVKQAPSSNLAECPCLARKMQQVCVAEACNQTVIHLVRQNDMQHWAASGPEFSWGTPQACTYTLLQDLLKPAPPAPPNAAPAPAPEQALPPQAGSGQPESGRKNGNGTSCKGQGMQGRCKYVPRRPHMHMNAPGSCSEDLSWPLGSEHFKAGRRSSSKAFCWEQGT